MDVQPTEVKVDADLPFAAMMFKGKIEARVEDHARPLVDLIAGPRSSVGCSANTNWIAS